jgi:hypothetical protein
MQVSKTHLRPDRRPLVYATLSLALSLVYALTFLFVVPSRHTGGMVLVMLLPLGYLALGAGIFVRKPWAYRVAVVSCVWLLSAVALVLGALVVSAAHLWGVYDAFGRAASTVTLVLALLSIQLFALIPGLVLKYLLSEDGRGYFSR